MTNKKLTQCLIAAGICLPLTSCMTPPLWDESLAKAKQDQQKLHTIYEEHMRKPPPVVADGGLYVDDTPIPIIVYPKWMKQNVSLQGNNLPFAFYVNNILANTPALPLYTPDFDKNKHLSVKYSGCLKGALDYLAAQVDGSYLVKGNDLVWSALLTKTFDVGFLPGTTDFQLGDSSAGSNTNANSASSIGGNTGGATGGASIVVTGATSTGNNFTNIKGKYSIWDDVAKALQNLLSKDGKATISQSTTTVMVQDHPSNLAEIGKYFKRLDKSLSRQVLIKVQVIDVALNHGFDYGIDWSLVVGSLGLQGQMATPVTLSGWSNTNSPFLSWLVTPGNAANQGTVPFTSKALINSLNTQGKVTVVTEPSIVTLNNQVGEIDITTQTGYLASVATTLTGGTTNAVQTSLTPGLVNTGFSIFVLPKIQGDKVFLNITAHISADPTFVTETSGTGINQQQIQVPTVNEKRFNERTLVSSGGTLILAGYKQVRTQTADNSPFGTGLFGGKGANKTNVETIITLTPIIQDLKEEKK